MKVRGGSEGSRWLLCGVGVGALLWSVGCTELVPNPNYCAAVNGDAFCADRHPEDGRAYCIWGSSECRTQLAPEEEGNEGFDGCITTPPPPEGDACYSPCGGGVGFDGECPMGAVPTTGAGETGVAGTSGDASGVASSTMGGETTGGGTADGDSTGTPTEGCVVDADCYTMDGAPLAPLCNMTTGQCVDCTEMSDGDAACAALDGEQPFCNYDSRECAECTRHEHCLHGVDDPWACDIFDGVCFSGDAQEIVVDDVDDLEEMEMSLAQSISRGGEEIIVWVGPIGDNGAPIELGETVIVNGKTVALIGFFEAMPSNEPPWRPEMEWDADSTPLLNVVGGGTVYIVNLRFTGGPDAAGTVACDGGRFDARRSFFTSDAGGNLEVSDCEARLENVFLRSRGANAPVMAVGDNASVYISYATIVGSDGQVDGFYSLLDCVGLRSSSNVLLRNSLVLTRGGGSGSVLAPGSCEFFQVSHSVLENAPLLGPTNIPLESPPGVGGMSYGSWFLGPDNLGNLHLNWASVDEDLAPAGFEYLEIAVPHPGDDPNDIDGESREVSAVVGGDVPSIPER